MSILKRPLVTEKASLLNKRGVYGLIVDSRSNKEQIRKEIERFYSVKVDSIHTMRYAGKKRIKRTAAFVAKGKRPAYKKAFVTLKEGGSIDFYSNIV
ncbi:MAG: 50S ribosomal protein L23 [Candidatus Cardinium sp.]|uniref:Large ribosomal subunit protein uL23 n=1 Tax=Candidatus Cardinium hertigii TaxID=247481 RepID=A0A2Z3LC63_9BACT|nr:50S ribosomal protein L23 [Candidatus Cardinium hertigii]AWN81762.1 50S ribosomal protein L23 [Candidatus Cardinium hertigii]MDD9139592.1 50S ribosomal protein L23 [Candidatus Cardinium sp.]